MRTQLTPGSRESWNGPRSMPNCDREGEATPAGRLAVAACLAAGLAACAAEPPRGASASYDQFTQRLVQVQADQNGDGRIDQWTYADGSRILRGEADTDGDGRVDRWEYFGEGSELIKVGTSSLGDGIEDTWTWAALVDGLVRVDRLRGRDRRVDRREFYRGDALERSEEDSNADGRTDRWDRYQNGVRLQTEFDTTLSAGRPNRRVIYDESGRFVRVEADPELDGTFVIVRATADELRGGKP
jgi:hypothetical protein